ncbi:MAG: hypothetical protein IKZ58_07370 [Selenomonadaceae bacterium]|nr:hypothetical protein [Selenomonadaceae bacterium]
MSEEKIMNYEMMSDDELGQVAGGNLKETADDSRFLNSLTGLVDRYNHLSLGWDFGGFKHYDIRQVWNKLGVKALLSSKCSNEYYINGQRVSQEEARQHAMKVFGKQMTEADWKW